MQFGFAKVCKLHQTIKTPQRTNRATASGGPHPQWENIKPQDSPKKWWWVLPFSGAVTDNACSTVQLIGARRRRQVGQVESLCWWSPESVDFLGGIANGKSRDSRVYWIYWCIFQIILINLLTYEYMYSIGWNCTIMSWLFRTVIV